MTYSSKYFRERLLTVENLVDEEYPGWPILEDGQVRSAESFWAATIKIRIAELVASIRNGYRQHKKKIN